MAKKPVRAKSKPAQPAWLKWVAIAALALALVAASVYFIGNPATTTLSKEISVTEAYNLYNEGAFLLDVRTQEEWNEYHAPDTTLIPLDQLEGRLDELPKDQTIVVVCRSGNRSQQGRDILLDAGFTDVTSMAGGLKTWRADGHPIVTGP